MGRCNLYKYEDREERLLAVQEHSEYPEFMFNFGMCVTSTAELVVPPLLNVNKYTAAERDVVN